MNVARPGDVVLTQRGTLGQVAIVPSAGYSRYIVSQSQMKLTVDQSVADAVFVYYFLRSPDHEAYLRNHTIQTGVPHTNLRILRETPIRLPPLEVQRSIARVLGALDDKIELNYRTNETLEAMARALFKSWFVDFDPVRAKQEGRTASGMGAATAALFPNGLVDSRVGQIPATWEVRPLAELTSKIGSGATPRGGSNVYLEQGIAFIRSQNVYDHEFKWDGLARISDGAAADLAGVSVKPGDILLNITGDSILRTCVVDPAALPARVSQHVAIIRARAGLSVPYLHLYLAQPAVKRVLLGMNTGATRQAITKGHLEALDVCVPAREVLRTFDAVTEPLFGLVEKHRAESRTLAALRDSLLPKLLSGELRVRDAERIAEAAL